MPCDLWCGLTSAVLPQVLCELIIGLYPEAGPSEEIQASTAFKQMEQICAVLQAADATASTPLTSSQTNRPLGRWAKARGQGSVVQKTRGWPEPSPFWHPRTLEVCMCLCVCVLICLHFDRGVDHVGGWNGEE